MVVAPPAAAAASAAAAVRSAPTPPPPSASASASSAALHGKRGVCRVEVARVEFRTTRPWQRTQQTRSTGTAFCIAAPAGGPRRQPLLLTSAHVVRATAVDIRVRQHGSTVRYPAAVTVYAPDCDLALLEIRGEKESAEFWGVSTSTASTTSAAATLNDGDNDDDDNNGNDSSSLALELADRLPALRESVHVVGYPTGGTTICITEGIVSRIDMVSASAFNNVLAIQIDAAINPGNSGGPAFDANGKVTGVAFLKNAAANTDGIGYLIPADVVRTFLGRCSVADRTYTLAPAMPYHWHRLENRSLRQFHRVPDDVHGVLLTSVCTTDTLLQGGGGGGALRAGDVLTHIDGKAVADDGQVVLRGHNSSNSNDGSNDDGASSSSNELIQHRYLLRGKRVDEPTTFSVYRNGAHCQCPPTVLRDIPSLCLRWANVDHPPDYLILGGLVLLPLSWSLRLQKKCGTRLVADCMDWCRRWPGEWGEGRTGLVVLTDILACELTFSYSRPWRRVTAYNGVPVLSLRHLSEMWEASCAAVAEASNNKEDALPPQQPQPEPTFCRLELEGDDPVVFEVQAAMEAQSAILETHQIPKACHISPPNPKYK